VKGARFVASARRELLAEVAYYNNKGWGLAVGFLLLLKMPLLAPSLIHLLGRRRQKALGECSSRTFLLRLCIDPMKME
jgi:hypothetical protein